MSFITSLKSVAVAKSARGILHLKKHSPEILTGIGILGMASSAYLAAKSTLDLPDRLEQFREMAQDVKDLHVDSEAPDQIVQYKRDMAYVYVRNTLEIGKLYAPAILTLASGAACIVAGMGILKRRNAALIIAYTALDKTFEKYRDRVIEKLGADAERDIRLGVVEEEVTDEETGKTKTVSHIDPNGYSPYARFFEESNRNFQTQPGYNLLFLRSQQKSANDLLQSRGHIFLNEVYDMLGIERTSAGQMVGWTLVTDGDCFVDFGIYDPQNEKAREFVNGYEKVFLLDFNVDGVVYDKI